MKLFDYQLEAVNKLKNGNILCGGVGSGKSLTSLAYFHKCYGGQLEPDFIKMFHPADLYIITTAQKRDTHEWEAEIAKFGLSISPKYNIYKNKVVIDSWNNILKYKNVSRAFFIFDEDHAVGSGVWAKTFAHIARHNQWILLTATPGDRWSDYGYVFVANGFFKNITEFRRNHCVYSAWVPYKIDSYINTGKLIKMRNSILVNMQYLKPAVSHTNDIYVSYDRTMYKKTIKTRFDFEKGEPIRDITGLCYKLRKICNTSPERISAMESLLKDHERCVIFYNFDYELGILRDLCKRLKRPVGEWNGHKHQDIPSTDEWAYLVQYTAGCEGWNCVKTNVVIFYSQNYSYRTLVQASGRIDRLNTPFTDLYYYHLKSRSGIDIAIAKAIDKKSKFNEGKFIKW